MYPVLFEIFEYEVSSFGVLFVGAFLIGLRLTSARMRSAGLDPYAATTMLYYCLLGGIAGAKLYYAVDTWLREGLPFWPLLFSRDGITFYGGLIGACVAGAIGCRIHGIPTKVFADSGAVACALGQAIGRVGCFLNGDDYGRVTDAPWGVVFPEGTPPALTPVHPTQLYEVLWLLPVSALLWWRWNKSPFLFGEYLALNGVGRIVVESWRVNPRVALGLTEPQLIGIGLIAVGTIWWLYYYRRDQPTEIAA